MSFRDDLLADFVNAIANPEEFGETVTYQPATGAARSINVRMDVTSVPAREEGVEQREDTAVVDVARDAALGIDRPQLGDRVYRHSDGEAPETPFCFTGFVDDSDPAVWTLRFVRRRPFRATPTA